MCTKPELYELDLTDVEVAAVDLETYDPDLKTKGSGAITKNGFVVGIAIATHKQTLYFPIRHLGKNQNGDPKQTDLYIDMKGGFENCIDKLEGIEGISICKLEGTDIVRNDIIAKILNRLND